MAAVKSRWLPVSRRIAVMLVLSRKVGERLVIGDNITVVVNRIAGNRVTLGIEAPGDVRIVRGELKPEDELAHANVETARPVAATENFGRVTDTRTVSLPRLAK
jgi:carbon storage regulator